MRKVGIYLINIYQKYISKMLHYKGIECKYYPSCSE